MKIKKRYNGFEFWVSNIECIQFNLLDKIEFGWWKLSKDYWTLKFLFLRIHRTTLPF